MNIRATLAVSVLCAALLTPVHAVWAADSAAHASIAAALQAQAGKRVKLHLVSGDALEGKVQSQKEQVVVIAELAGMEFFSATVRLDQVAAAVARTTSPQ